MSSGGEERTGAEGGTRLSAEEWLKEQKSSKYTALNINNRQFGPFTPDHPLHLDRFSHLTRLSMAGCGISSIEGFPSFPSLTLINFEDNQISGGLGVLVGQLPAVATIILSRNPIKSPKELEPLGELAHLSTVETFQCPMRTHPGYRQYMFASIPSLTLLDMVDRDGKLSPKARYHGMPWSPNLDEDTSDDDSLSDDGDMNEEGVEFDEDDGMEGGMSPGEEWEEDGSDEYDDLGEDEMVIEFNIPMNAPMPGGMMVDGEGWDEGEIDNQENDDEMLEQDGANSDGEGDAGNEEVQNENPEEIPVNLNEDMVGGAANADNQAAGVVDHSDSDSDSDLSEEHLDLAHVLAHFNGIMGGMMEPGFEADNHYTVSGLRERKEKVNTYVTSLGQQPRIVTSGPGGLQHYNLPNTANHFECQHALTRTGTHRVAFIHKFSVFLFDLVTKQVEPVGPCNFAALSLQVGLGYVALGGNHGKVVVFDLQNDTCYNARVGGRNYVNGLAIVNCTDTPTLLVAHNSGRIFACTLPTLQVISEVYVRYKANDVKACPRGHWVAVATDDDTVLMMSLSADAKVWTEPMALPCVAKGARRQYLAWNCNGTRLAAGSAENAEVLVWNAEDRQAMPDVFPTAGSTLAVDFSPIDPHLLVVGERDLVFHIINIETHARQAVRFNNGPGQPPTINGLCFAPDGLSILEARKGNTLIGYPLRTVPSLTELCVRAIRHYETEAQARESKHANCHTDAAKKGPKRSRTCPDPATCRPISQAELSANQTRRLQEYADQTMSTGLFERIFSNIYAMFPAIDPRSEDFGSLNEVRQQL